MVYASKVKGQKLTFCVSGKLWNRSLLMMDTETGSFWSQILCEAVEGKMKGAELETLPCDMVTWKAWRAEHPETTVLDLSRTSKNYTAEFYKRPERFCLGMVVEGAPYHATFTALRKQSLLNLELEGEPLLLTFDKKSTSARLFSRRIDGRALKFVQKPDGSVTDGQTGSTWNRATGMAVKGKLKGKSLESRVGIVSFTRKWQEFHPDSRSVSSRRRL